MAKKAGKFILNIGDEGGILTYMHGKAVTRRLYASSPNYADTRAFVDLMQSDPKAPVSMLVDLMDQSYIQHTLPPVSPLTINNLIKRKLDRDFASDELKGALQIGREKEGRKDWKYLFVTLSDSPSLQSWLDLVMEQQNRFEGIYLLPVEAENFIQRLQTGISGPRKKGRKKTEESLAPVSQWQLLVAHNKVGGFRQVVLKDDKLIFARLAQPIGDNQPAVIAGNIEQEISVTIEYLKRLGYNDEQGMDVYIIAADQIRASIETKNIQVAQVYALTPHEVALRLSLDSVTEPEDQFADVVMAAAFATAKKRLLRLQTKMQMRLNQMYSGLMALKYGGALVTALAVASALYYATQAPGASEDIQRFESQIRMAQQDLQEVMDQEKSLPDDLEKMTDLVALYQQLKDLGLYPLDTLQRFGESRAYADVRLSKLTWEVASRTASASADQPYGGGQSDTAGETLKLSLEIDMYGTQVGRQAFDERVQVYLDALKTIFPGHEVKLTSERPGLQTKTTGFSLGEEQRDPILEQPFFPLKIEVTGSTAPASAEAAQEAMPPDGMAPHMHVPGAEVW